MKRFLSALLAVILCASLFAGCSAPAESSQALAESTTDCDFENNMLAITNPPKEVEKQGIHEELNTDNRLTVSEATYYFHDTTSSDYWYGHYAVKIENTLDRKARINFINIDLIDTNEKIIYHTEDHNVVPAILNPNDIAYIGSQFSISKTIDKDSVNRMEIYFTYYDTDCVAKMIDFNNIGIQFSNTGNIEISGRAVNNTGSDIDFASCVAVVFDKDANLISANFFAISDLLNNAMSGFSTSIYGSAHLADVADNVIVQGMNTIDLPWEDEHAAYSSNVFSATIYDKSLAGETNVIIDDTPSIEVTVAPSLQPNLTPVPDSTTPVQDYSVSQPTKGERNALSSARQYLDYMAFSYKGLIDQLEYEGYSTEEATYAADNCGADWNEQAVKSAKQYLDYMSFSRSGLIEQLEYEGFTHEQAVYGAEQNGY